MCTNTGADAVLPPDGDLVKLSSTLPFDDEAGSSMLENEESGNAENLDKSAAPASLKLSKIDLSGIIGTPQRNKILPPKIEEDSSDEETEALTSSDRLTGSYLVKVKQNNMAFCLAILLIPLLWSLDLLFLIYPPLSWLVSYRIRIALNSGQLVCLSSGRS